MLIFNTDIHVLYIIRRVFHIIFLTITKLFFGKTAFRIKNKQLKYILPNFYFVFVSMLFHKVLQKISTIHLKKTSYFTNYGCIGKSQSINPQNMTRFRMYFILQNGRNGKLGLRGCKPTHAEKLYILQYLLALTGTSNIVMVRILWTSTFISF